LIEATPHASLLRHIGERAIPVVVEQLVPIDVGDEQVRPPVIVVVSHGHSNAESGATHASFVGNIGERQVVVVVVQPFLYCDLA